MSNSIALKTFVKIINNIFVLAARELTEGNVDANQSQQTASLIITNQ